MRRLRMSSVRVRSSVAAVAVVGLALAAGGALLVALLQRSLQAGVDASARLQAQAVVTTAGGGKLSASFPAAGNDTAFVQVVDQSGRVVAASTNVADEPVLVHRAPGSDARVVTVRGLPIGDEGPFRVAVQRATTNTVDLTVYAAIALGPAERTVRALAVGLIIGLPLVLAVVAGAAWWLAGRALAPVEAMRAQVADIADHRDLHRRVPEPVGEDELSRLAKTMNRMLGSLDDGAQRQRQFVADASHELRSPVASARAQLEVDLAHPQRVRWEETAEGVLAELSRIEGLVADLLALARADAGHGMIRSRRPVELDALVRQEATSLVDIGGVRPVTVVGDPEGLRRVVRNLLDNALRHAATRVVVTLQRVGTVAELVVADDGPGIPISERERIFERFGRLDGARSRDGGGAGLGLAIVRSAVEAHGGIVQVDDNHPGARFIVRLPVEDDPQV